MVLFARRQNVQENILNFRLKYSIASQFTLQTSYGLGVFTSLWQSMP